MNLNYEYIATDRNDSLFKDDMGCNYGNLYKNIRNSRITVVGAAGSIGASVVKTILNYEPNALTLIDINENNLVELVRDLRSTDGIKIPQDFLALPIAMGSIEFNRYFQDQEPFDYFLNLSAIKHVRSEKNIYCIMRMIDTNVLFLHDFLEQNKYLFKKFFSVSSDKAVNPVNVMGATKMAMEKALMLRSNVQPFSTGRFANVAFSDGSLPYGFLQRIYKKQPVSAPNDVRRYFITHQEAGELCVMSCFLGENRDVFFPKILEGKNEKTFSEIAVSLLMVMGYEPIECSSEEEAKAKCSELIPHKKWPCYFFKTDTTGEKDFEEFYTEKEETDFRRFKKIGVIKRGYEKDHQIESFISFAKNAKNDLAITKLKYIEELSKLVSGLNHLETGKNLDQKM